ncbi:MAG TPA: TylF/MycF/NovP-related O-methyltransferase, partial [Nitrososphaeraceae archaeon]|nr:TylF/MycF/NovP-related O-methyltransferase [Nitrososphaeraceae archaeon]
MRTEKLRDYYLPGGSRREEALSYVTKPGDILQFGVFSGSSMAYIHEYYTKKGLEYGIMWGFDSFEGLPDEQKGVKIDPDWPKGAFNAEEWFGQSSDEIIK